jgi:hypothetical protein
MKFFILRNLYLRKFKKQPGVESQTCNPSYMGGKDREDHSSRPTVAKSAQDPHLNQ